MNLTYKEIIDIMDANAGYLSMDTPENLYKFLNAVTDANRGSIMEFCYNDLKYPLLDKLNALPSSIFYKCKLNFNTWTAGPNITQIDTLAFYDCKLDTVDLSNTKIIGLMKQAFYDSKVKKVILPEGLEKIGIEAFKHSSIEEIYIPSTVESIGKDSFKGCNNLQKVHLCRDSIAQGKLTLDANDLAAIKNKVTWY